MVFSFHIGALAVSSVLLIYSLIGPPPLILHAVGVAVVSITDLLKYTVALLKLCLPYDCIRYSVRYAVREKIQRHLIANLVVLGKGSVVSTVPGALVLALLVDNAVERIGEVRRLHTVKYYSST